MTSRGWQNRRYVMKKLTTNRSSASQPCQICTPGSPLPAEETILLNNWLNKSCRPIHIVLSLLLSTTSRPVGHSRIGLCLDLAIGRSTHTQGQRVQQ